MRRFSNPWLWAVGLPVASLVVVGLLVDLAVGDTAPALSVRAQAGLGALLAVSGIALGILAAAVLGMRLATQGAIRRALRREQNAQADAHRRFIGRLDHELKNPLTAITAGLANLAEVTPNGAAASLHNVRRQVDRLSTLSGDLRKLADLESRPLEQAPVDIAALVDEVVELAEARPDGAGNRLVTSIQRVPWPPPPVLGDRDLLLLAVYNLLDNALKFSPPDARIEIRARDDGRVSVVEVADSGFGIAEGDLAHVKEELYRGQSRQMVEGSGLGLALVDRIVQLHHGELVITSRPQLGTVASLRLPAMSR